MNHKKGYRKLNKPTDQRMALLKNLTRAIFESHKMKTTLTRAKEVSRIIDKIINLSKKGTIHARREIFKFLPDRDLIKKIFSMSGKFKDKNSGYSRITVLGRRRGDSSKIALVELIL